LLAIIAAAAVVVLVFVVPQITGNWADKDYFDIGTDQVPSVKLVLGEDRDISSVNSSKSGGVETIIIKYKVDENQNREMEKYANALMDEYGFINTTAYNFSGTTGSGFQFAKESSEEGVIVLVDIDYDESGYILTLTRGVGTLTIHEEPPEPEPVIEEEEEPALDDTFEVFVPSIFNSFAEGDVLDKANIYGFDFESNPDGSFLLYLTEAQQESILESLSYDFAETFQIIVDDDLYVGLYEIEWTNDFSDIILRVSDDFFYSDETMLLTLFYIAFTAPMYQVYQGYGDYSKTVVSIHDIETDDYLVSYLLPDELFDIYGG